MTNGKMNGFNVEEDEEAAGKRQKGDSWSRTHVQAQAQHRRSKRFCFFFFLPPFSKNKIKICYCCSDDKCNSHSVNL